ncbi:MAG: hypothetical protein P8I94_06735 [Emcibacteraceae bacterium]|nr:hypothetical protein [Emcibacteraceae bacterium]
MDFDIFDVSFEDLMGNETPETSGIHVPTKPRIRAYSPEYYEWIEPEMEEAPVQLPVQETVTPVVVGKCKKCDGKGTWYYRIGRCNLPCGRCGGDGKLTAEDVTRHANYETRKASGKPMAVNFTQFFTA